MIERPQKFGGNVEYQNYSQLETAYREGTLHPADLKRGVAEALDRLIEPVRTHFERDPSARRLYEAVKSAEVTR